MATSIIFSNNLFLFLPSVFYMFFLVLHPSKKYCYASQAKLTTSGTDHHTHIFRISSLLSSTECNKSTKAINDRKSTLEIVHKHGPCFEMNQGKANNYIPSHAEILSQDQWRVDSIHSMLSKNSSVEEMEAATRLPTKNGVAVGSGNYLVAVSLGTPGRRYALIFDTGSDLTWTQCEPCAGFCHDQVEPIFNPSKSKSYANISCHAATCKQIILEGMEQSCYSSTCAYRISYADSSLSEGFLAKEKLTISQSDVFPSYIFGCGQNNRFLSRSRVAGVIGLGRGKFSLVSQTANKYKKTFSYCLPSDDNSTGYLTFGQTKHPNNTVKFTPMPKPLRRLNAPFYGLDIVGINVGGQRLPIDRSVFKAAGAIIDSGTVITRLPPTAYAQLKSKFQEWMSSYPKAAPLSILDTCYDFSRSDVIVTPTIAMVFNGGVEVKIDFSGVYFVRNESQWCLAFAANRDDGDVAIFGNFQQKTYQVVYDDVKARIGFAAGGCS